MRSESGALGFDLEPAGRFRRLAWGLARPPLSRLLGLARFRHLYEGRPPGSSASEFIDWALERLAVEVRVDAADLERIPARGPLVVVANHPFGGVEGMILGRLLLRRRPDVRILANYVLGRLSELRELFLLVDPYGGAGAVRANLSATRRAMGHLAAGGALALFPAGEVSHLSLRRREVADPTWLDTAAHLVRRAGCPVVPVYFPGRNGWMFQAAGLLHARLRTALLLRELLRRRESTIEARVGNAIAWRQLAAYETPGELTAYLRSRTYILSQRPPLSSTAVQPRVTPRFAEPVAAAGSREALVEEVEGLAASHLLVDTGDEAVYVAEAAEIPRMMHEIGRQRELTFREVGEGTGREIDLDEFDRAYLHLFVWSRVDRRLVGAYRIGRTDELMRGRGPRGLYTSTLFAYKPRLFEAMGPALEMGRSFIRPEYQRSYTGLMLLWKGIGQFVLRDPRYATLFGPVSISADYQSASQRLIASFLEQNKFAHEWSRWVRPRAPTRPEKPVRYGLVPSQLRDLDDVSTFIAEIEADQKGVPILLKQYLRLGGRLLGFNVDPAFSNVLDVLIMVDLRRTEPKILSRYMGREGTESFREFHRETGSRFRAS